MKKSELYSKAWSHFCLHFGSRHHRIQPISTFLLSIFKGSCRVISLLHTLLSDKSSLINLELPQYSGDLSWGQINVHNSQKICLVVSQGFSFSKLLLTKTDHFFKVQKPCKNRVCEYYCLPKPSTMCLFKVTTPG